MTLRRVREYPKGVTLVRYKGRFWMAKQCKGFYYLCYYWTMLGQKKGRGQQSCQPNTHIIKITSPEYKKETSKVHEIDYTYRGVTIPPFKVSNVKAFASFQWGTLENAVERTQKEGLWK